MLLCGCYPRSIGSFHTEHILKHYKQQGKENFKVNAIFALILSTLQAIVDKLSQKETVIIYLSLRGQNQNYNFLIGI